MKHASRAAWMLALALFLLARPVMAEVPAQSARATGRTAAQAAATTEPVHPIPDLPENQAEIEALTSGQLVLEPAPAVGTTPASTGSLSPEMLEIEQALTAERARLAELEARLRNKAEEVVVLSLLREIEQVKQDAEVEILRIQAKHARLAGREAQAQEIEATVMQILAPVPGSALAAPPASAAEADSSARSGDARR
jgi:hypothetical protein